jgi:hypothetical protein
MNVSPIREKLLPRPDPLIAKSALPHLFPWRQFSSCSKRVTAFDLLHRPFHGRAPTERDKRMEVVGHNNKCMQSVFTLIR